MRAAISVLVLLFSMCGAQTRSTQTEVQTESQSTGAAAAAAAAAEVSTQLDFSAELKELIDMVVELGEALRYTRDKLKRMEGENSAVKERLGVSEKELSVLKTRIAASEDEGMNMKKETDAKSADLRSVAERLSATKAELENLEKTSESYKVAFSASCSGGSSYDNEEDVVCHNVITNAGYAYSSSTGFFTAPVRGLYFFTFTVRDSAGAMYRQILMYKNGLRLMHLYEFEIGTGHPSHMYSGLTLQLELGDVVNLRLPPNSGLSCSEKSNHCTFSGFLIVPL